MNAGLEQYKSLLKLKTRFQLIKCEILIMLVKELKKEINISIKLSKENKKGEFQYISLSIFFKISCPCHIGFLFLLVYEGIKTCKTML